MWQEKIINKFENLKKNGDVEMNRQEIIDFLKLQIENNKKNPENSEEIAYNIAGLLSLESVHSLDENDPIIDALTMAGELELPSEHRSDNTTWENFIQLVEKL